jgi:hypothetical protein
MTANENITDCSVDSLDRIGTGLTKGLQINLRKSPLAMANLVKKCAHVNSHIIFMQEPRIVKGKISLNRLTLHYKSQTDNRKPRAAIGHSADLDIYAMSNLTDHDVCTCMWYRPGKAKPTILISAYWDGQINTIPIFLSCSTTPSCRTTRYSLMYICRIV